MDLYKNISVGSVLVAFMFLFTTQLYCEHNTDLNNTKLLNNKRITIENYNLAEALKFSNKYLIEPLRLSRSKDFIYSIRNLCTIRSTDELKKIRKAKENALENDLGIKFKAGIRESSGNLNLYSNSAFAGISWDLVKDGYLENRLKLEEFLIKQSIVPKSKRLLERKLLSLYRQNYVSYYFAKLKIPILKKKIKILNELMRVKREGYFYGIELADSLVKIERETEKAKAELNQYEELVYTYCNIEKFSFCKYNIDGLPPVLSVRFNKVMKELIHSEVLKEEENFRNGNKLIELKNNWRHKVKLGAYLYYNMKGDSSFFSKKGLVGGLNLSYPLDKNYKTIDRMELMLNRNNLEREKKYLVNYANLLFREEEEKVSDAVNIWYGMDIAFERIRRENIKVRNDIKKGTVYYRDYLALLENLKNYLDSEFEFVSSEGLLYRRIANLLTITGVNWNDKTREVKLTPLGNRFRVGRRYVILKKIDIAPLSKEFIVNLLYTKGIKGVVMEKSLFETQKGNKLFKALHNIGIKCYLLDTKPSKSEKVPLCLNTKNLGATMANWQCILFEGRADKRDLMKLLNRTNILFVPQKDAILRSDRLGIKMKLKHGISELELEKRLDKLYKLGIKNFLFDFGELMDIYRGGPNEASQ